MFCLDILCVDDTCIFHCKRNQIRLYTNLHCSQAKSNESMFMFLRGNLEQNIWNKVC